MTEKDLNDLKEVLTSLLNHIEKATPETETREGYDPFELTEDEKNFSDVKRLLERRRQYAGEVTPNPVPMTPTKKILS
jgi:hypothetical protein